MKKPRPTRPILKSFGLLTLAAFIGLGTLFASLWIERRGQLTLPTPTGTFAVGRSIYDWVDNQGFETLAPTPGIKRELLVWFWYPAEPAPSATVDAYVPASVRPPASTIPLVFRLLTHDLTKVRGHSFRDAGLSPRQKSYPVVMMRAGTSAPVVNYSTLAEDLASHGYVVVGFDAPYRTMDVVFPDGRMIERRPENNAELFSGAELTRIANKLLAAWTSDTAFVLDRLQNLNASDPTGKFTGRLDLTRVGLFGHSFGGATSAQFCSQDPRCKAGIDVDGSLHGSVVQAGLHIPFMFLLSDHGDFSSDAETRQIMTDIQSVYDRLPPNERLRAMIRGANHFTFSDDGALLKSRLMRGLLRIFGQLGIRGRRQLEITSYCLDTFFDAYLKSANGARPNLDTHRYPELRVAL